MVVLEKLNESTGVIQTTDYSMMMDIWENFQFYVPGYKFMPSYKHGSFDGKIKLINLATKQFPLGLGIHIQKYVHSLDEDCTMSPEMSASFMGEYDDVKIKRFFEDYEFFSKKNKITPRPDQMDAVVRAIKYSRAINICPTSFGKSLAIFMQCLWHIKNDRRIIIVVPSISLVEQFDNDIRDYCTNENGEPVEWTPKTQQFRGGLSKVIDYDTQICISTWQSLYKLDSEFINQFDVLILDECHSVKGNSIQSVLNASTTIKYRTGWTGTIEEKTLNKLTAEGLFGPIKEIVTTKDLMDRGIVASLNIIAAQLRYDEELSKDVGKLDYASEIKYLTKNKKRMKTMMNIVDTQEKTGLILYRNIEHGENIQKSAREKFKDRNVYLIHSGYFQINDTKYKSLEELKPIMEQDPSGIIIANYQLLSTGVNVKNLHWIMFAAPTKSYITTIQSIGRGLRISKTKTKVTLIDIVDDFSYKKRVKTYYNYAMQHFIERFKYYTEKKFKYHIVKINM